MKNESQQLICNRCERMQHVDERSFCDGLRAKIPEINNSFNCPYFKKEVDK